MERRGFAKRLASVIIGGILGAVPLGSALAFLLDPLRRKSETAGFLRVTSLDALPDGKPKKYQIVADRSDAWNFYKNEPIGAVYLVRNGDDVTAFQVICPHLGCFVDYEKASSSFKCPCHASTFKVDGSRDLIANPKTPAARDLDSLEVSVRAGDVYVRYQKFQGHISEKITIT